MTEFWEDAFKSKQEMWGFEPSESAVLTKNLFVEYRLKNILIPGIGYGRNAKIFKEHGMSVTGIEISQTAIDLAQKHFGTNLQIHYGSVTEMPFDDKIYDGIFCYALIHLLDKPEREKLLHDCYCQLAKNGFMVFTAISTAAETYGQGLAVGYNRFEMFGGVKIFFYDEGAIHEEFGEFGLVEISQVKENYPLYLIKCTKR